jgi:ABC-type sugar transport system permease subunit
VTKAFNDGLQAALTGSKTAEVAMKDAQKEAERLLRTYKRSTPRERAKAGTRLAALLPALTLLVAFTHYPAIATLIDSFMSTPKPNRASVFVGIDNYAAMVDDPIFWQALRNNLWFALATIPLSVGLALAMALWVNGKIAGRGFCAWRTSRLQCYQ